MAGMDKMYQETSARDNKAGCAACVILLMLLGTLVANAQMTLGEDLNMRMNGNLGYGYTGAFGNNDLQSTHGSGFTGNALLTGYYFHPNFLSFEVRPYYDRTQSNSESQVVSRSTGIGASVNLFGGSRFPGSISYGKEFSSASEFRVAGVSSVLGGETSGRSFAIAWSALIPKWPQLRANYYTNTSNSTVTGTEADSKNSSKNLAMYSDYNIAGFDLRGNFNALHSDYTTPAFLTGEEQRNSGSNITYGLTAQHKLPLSGNLGLGWSHSDYSSNIGGDSSSSSYSAGAGFTPWTRFSFHQEVSYTTNLAAAFRQSLPDGVLVPTLMPDNDSHSLNFNTGATWAIGHGFTVNGHYGHRQQSFMEREYVDSQIGGTLNYNFNTRLFGLFYLGFGVVDTADKNGNNGAGLIGNVGMSKKFGKWDTSADFNYAQNVQTIVSIATTSSYTYGGSVRRKITPDLRWNFSYRASQSGLVIQEGSANKSQNFNSSISWKRYAVSGTYGQSEGAAVLNSSGGLTSTPVGSLFTDDFILFNARSYGVSVSTLLFRRVTLFGGYSSFNSTTAASKLSTFNEGERYNGRMEYRLRKFSIIGGFNRSGQDVSTIPGGPRIVNSYYLSLSRWFNVF
jgi:hypothetical protein